MNYFLQLISFQVRTVLMYVEGAVPYLNMFAEWTLCLRFSYEVNICTQRWKANFNMHFVCAFKLKAINLTQVLKRIIQV